MAALEVEVALRMAHRVIVRIKNQLVQWGHALYIGHRNHFRLQFRLSAEHQFENFDRSLAGSEMDGRRQIILLIIDFATIP